MSCPKIYLTIINKKDQKRHYHALSTQWRRIYSRIGRAEFKKCVIKVVYGKFTDVFGKQSIFDNTAEFDNPKEVNQAKETLKVFLKEIG